MKPQIKTFFRIVTRILAWIPVIFWVILLLSAVYNFYLSPRIQEASFKPPEPSDQAFVQAFFPIIQDLSKSEQETLQFSYDIDKTGKYCAQALINLSSSEGLKIIEMASPIKTREKFPWSIFYPDMFYPIMENPIMNKVIFSEDALVPTLYAACYQYALCESSTNSVQNYFGFICYAPEENILLLVENGMNKEFLENKFTPHSQKPRLTAPGEPSPKQPDY